MVARAVRARLTLNTPTGQLEKVVNWSVLESRAVLTRSSTAENAYKKFLVDGPQIIASSGRVLVYLTEISFYEEERRGGELIPKIFNQTGKIKIIREDSGMKFLT